MTTRLYHITATASALLAVIVLVLDVFFWRAG